MSKSPRKPAQLLHVPARIRMRNRVVSAIGIQIAAERFPGVDVFRPVGLDEVAEKGVEGLLLLPDREEHERLHLLPQLGEGDPVGRDMVVHRKIIRRFHAHIYKEKEQRNAWLRLDLKTLASVRQSLEFGIIGFVFPSTYIDYSW